MRSPHRVSQCHVSPASSAGPVAAPARHPITVTGTAQGELTFSCLESESILAAMHRLGQRGIPLGCRSGGCGVCAVEVLSGSYHTGAMSRSHISTADEAAGRVLACRLYPRSALRLSLRPKLASCLTAAAGRRPSV